MRKAIVDPMTGRAPRTTSNCSVYANPPGWAPVSAGTPRPVEFSGSQTTRSGISVTAAGVRRCRRGR